MSRLGCACREHRAALRGPSPGCRGVSRGGAESVAADSPCAPPALRVLHVQSGWSPRPWMLTKRDDSARSDSSRGSRLWTSPMFTPRLRTLLTSAGLDGESQSPLLAAPGSHTMDFDLDPDDACELLGNRELYERECGPSPTAPELRTRALAPLSSTLDANPPPRVRQCPYRTELHPARFGM